MQKTVEPIYDKYSQSWYLIEPNWCYTIKYQELPKVTAKFRNPQEVTAYVESRDDLRLDPNYPPRRKDEDKLKVSS